MEVPDVILLSLDSKCKRPSAPGPCYYSLSPERESGFTADGLRSIYEGLVIIKQ